MRKKSNYNYIGLIKELSMTDFKLKYQGSFFGYLWSLAKPLMFFSVLYFVFTRFFRLGESIPNYPVYLLLGIVLFNYFVESTMASMGSIVGKGDLIRKVYFPRIILTISTSITALITLFLNLVVVFIFMFFSKAVPSIDAPLLILLLIELFILTSGVSLFLASMFVRFRDIAHIWDVINQVLFYAVPIIYPLSFVPEKIGKILLLNPLAQIIQDSRYVLITDKTITASTMLSFPYILVPYVTPFMVFGLGYWFFQKSAAKFAEEV